ncbi:DUF2628 domain-containing protein [Roseibium sp. RKSG952]|uniref:DUF2628 domain-containing protein n=1 Tax=Roseibium sp. RKSG952 TaxID=2529384 RepID=UPI0012BBDE2A|nr:DUF2628 domain-containing protein [Roseibium sp. RKSG952]MTI01130.1 DUF2628 domain-containing protein [Roseibium sp. RKSG952]
MTTYFVMAPPDVRTPVASAHQADRLVFVPDRFSALAFVFSLIWIVLNRMWLVLLAYLVITLVLEIAASGIGGLAPSIAAAAVALAFGFEAHSLKRWSLERKGWKTLAMVCGDDREEAELRFFRNLADRSSQPAASTTDTADFKPNQTTRPAGIVPRVGTEQVVGLTLRPEPRR